MPASAYVVIYNFIDRNIVYKRFNRSAQAVDFVKRFSLKGHVVVAYRGDEILFLKSDVLCSTGVTPILV